MVNKKKTAQSNLKPIKKAEKLPLEEPKKQSNVLWIALILILTIIVFFPALKCSFTSWDDPLYVTESTLIKSLSIDNIIKIFSTKEAVAANYHPLTIISLAIDYHFSKLNPATYHFTNLLLHILNTLLLYLFIIMLTNGKTFIALFSALFFGIHPLHVESVAWISERKDVLYTFFFFLSLLSYLVYTKTKKFFWYAITFLLFVCSVLSKAMAVVLPLILILIDYLRDRNIILKKIYEKIPFFIISLLFGIIAVKIQSKESIASYETFSLFQRICFGFYGYFTYIWKLFLPVNLSSFYPYPTAGKEIAFPVSMYLPALAGILVFICSLYYLFYKKDKYKWISFGFAFYFITVVFVLQFISVGQVIMADRYSYLSYSGLLFSAGWIINNVREKNPSTKKVILFAVCAIALIFSFISRERIKVWQNTDTLWTDVIEKYPYPPWAIEIAYVGRGRYNAENNNLEKALADFNTLLEMKTKNPAVYNNLGNIYGIKGQQFQNQGDTSNAGKAFQKSMDYYSTAIKLDSSSNTNAFSNRATAYIFMKEYALAAADFDKAMQLDPSNNSLLEKRAYSYYMSDNWTKAIEDYTQLLSISKDKTYMYQFRGVAFMNSNRFADAIPDFKITAEREPKNGQVFYYLSLCYGKLNDQSTSMNYLNQANQLGYKANQRK
jgi:tetratricopeptide (TPR) repeat protein